MGLGRDQPRNPWIYSQTRICSQASYRLHYAAHWSVVATFLYIFTYFKRYTKVFVLTNVCEPKTFYQNYDKTCLKRPLKKNTKNWFSRPIIPQCRSKVLQNALLEHFAILSTFIKLPFVCKTFVLSIFEWLLKTGFTVLYYLLLWQSVTS